MTDASRPPSEHEARAQRAARRRERMSVRYVAPGERDEADVRGEEAISLVTLLTRSAWALTEQPMPSYPREAIPVAFVPWADRDGPPPRLP